MLPSPWGEGLGMRGIKKLITQLRKKLAIITTHPIQYYAPVFKLLARHVELKVFYTWGEASMNKFDPGFGKKIAWDLPLLGGYDYEFLNNTSRDPGSHHFKGIINPDAIQKIKAFQPDAILIYGWSYQSHLRIIRHFKGKVSAWFRGDSNLLDTQKGWKRYLRGIFLRWVYSHVDKAFNVGSVNKAYFKKYGLKEEQLIFAPHAIDNERFSTNHQEEASALRKELGVKDEDILVLFAGKLEPKKDPELLLSAFMKLNLAHVHLLFVGNGVLEEKLKAESRKLKSRIHFIDFQNQQKMPVIYQSSDLFCLPSKGPGETWGLAVNEAMAAGKAVLVSDKVGCAADLVQSGKNGEIFQSNNLQNLKDKLSKLCADRDNLSRMGTYSRTIIANWTFEKQVDAFIKEIQG